MQNFGYGARRHIGFHYFFDFRNPVSCFFLSFSNNALFWVILIQHAGANFNPHVSTGVAPTDYLDAMIAEPFAAFAFAPAGAAIYQLGPFGTAARLLKQLEVAR